MSTRQSNHQLFFKYVHQLFKVAAHSFAVTVWGPGSKEPPMQFIDRLEACFGINLIWAGESQPGTAGFVVINNIVVSAFAADIDDKVKTQLWQLNQTGQLQPIVFAALKLLNKVIAMKSTCGLVLTDELRTLFRMVWQKSDVVLPRDDRKQNHVAYHYVSTLLFNTLGYLLNCHQRENNANGLHIQGYYAPGWKTVELAQEMARCSILPTCQNLRDEVTAIVVNQPHELEQWADQHGIIVNVLVKAVSRLLDGKKQQLESYFAELGWNATQSQVVLRTLYRTDQNGFGAAINLCGTDNRKQFDDVVKGFQWFATRALLEKRQSATACLGEKLLSYRLLSHDRSEGAVQLRACGAEFNVLAGVRRSELVQIPALQATKTVH